MRRRILLLLAATAVTGATTAPAALATHACSPILRDVCWVTCHPVQIYC